jgi:hypothetical protein
MANATQTPSDRQLVVFENNASNPDHGRMFAIPPDQAKGIGLQAFTVVNALPAAASVEGEAVFNTTDGVGYIWDGAAWQAFVPLSPYHAPTGNKHYVLTSKAGTNAVSWEIPSTYGIVGAEFDQSSGVITDTSQMVPIQDYRGNVHGFFAGDNNSTSMPGMLVELGGRPNTDLDPLTVTNHGIITTSDGTHQTIANTFDVTPFPAIAATGNNYISLPFEGPYHETTSGNDVASRISSEVYGHFSVDFMHHEASLEIYYDLCFTEKTTNHQIIMKGCLSVVGKGPASDNEWSQAVNGRGYKHVAFTGAHFKMDPADTSKVLQPVELDPLGGIRCWA